MAGRSIRQIRNEPERLSDVTIQPIMFVLLFAEVFGTAISIPGGGSYHEYLLPGIIAQSTVFGCFGSSVGMATTGTRASSTDCGRCPSRAAR